MKPILVLLGALILLPATAAAPGWARGSGTERGAVTRHLLEKGIAHLRTAEGAHFAGKRERARESALRAEQLFRDALAQDPTDLSIPLLGGQAATLAGDLEGAGNWAARLRQLAPLGENHPELHYLRAFIHILGEDRPDLGQRELQRMYSLDPRVRPTQRDNLWFLALLDFGRALVKAEKYTESLVHFRTGTRIARRLGNRVNEHLMLGNLGVALQRGKRWLEAEEIFQALVKLEPENVIWQWQLGLTLASQAEFVDAIPVYRRVIQLREAGQVGSSLEQEMKRVRLRLGNCLRLAAERDSDPNAKQEKLGEAEESLRAYLRAEPEDPLAHKWLGVMLYQNLDKPYEALPYLEKAWALDPYCVDSLKLIIQIHEHYPPPPSQLPADDEAQAEAARKAWKAPLEGWKKTIEDGEEERAKVLKERSRNFGTNGCI